VVRAFHWVAETGGGLSGGERQRLSVARAVLKNAPILILDEPTSSLDAISEEIVFAALRRLRTGRTTIVIAHRLSTVRDADCILVLDGGRIAASGRHEELLKSSQLYRRMCARLSVGKSLDDPETRARMTRLNCSAFGTRPAKAGTPSLSTTPAPSAGTMSRMPSASHCGLGLSAPSWPSATIMRSVAARARDSYSADWRCSRLSSISENICP
jgi:ABC-type glutathione transport system ATPase component